MLRTRKKQLWSGSILLCYPIRNSWSAMECKEVCIHAHGRTAKQQHHVHQVGSYQCLSNLIFFNRIFHLLLQILGFFFLFGLFSKFVSYFCFSYLFKKVSLQRVCFYCHYKVKVAFSIEKKSPKVLKRNYVIWFPFALRFQEAIFFPSYWGTFPAMM